MGYHDGGWTAGDWLAMSAMMFLFLAVLVALAVWLVRTISGRDERRDAERVVANRADEVLAERYARGEIDEDEFGRRRDLLHNGFASRP